MPDRRDFNATLLTETWFEATTTNTFRSMITYKQGDIHPPPISLQMVSKSQDAEPQETPYISHENQVRGIGELGQIELAILQD